MVQTTTQRPVPSPSPETQPFWDGCAKGQLLLQRCTQCGAYRHPPSPICAACLSTEDEWLPASGRGTVYTFSIVRQALARAWQPFVPYVVAVIELKEGPRVVSNVVGIEPEAVQIGMGVEVVFEPISDAITLPLFRPI